MSMKIDSVNVGLDLRALDPEFKAHFGRGTGRYALELRNALRGLKKSFSAISSL